jgi:hypothetical protein
MAYTGWPAVENATTALADASALLMLPGNRCENGRAAPITEPDWIKFTDQMISVARRSYRLAQTKNKEALSEFTLDLTNACNACHRVYRDVGGRGGAGKHIRALHAPITMKAMNWRTRRINSPPGTGGVAEGRGDRESEFR